MINNPIIQKSIRFLTQPYTLLVLVIYAFNEFILQRYAPSWISGKLSDFAWLFIAPVILTLLLAWILPARLQKQSNSIAFLAYGITGLFFIGLKIVPPVHDFIMQSWMVIFRVPASVVMDATDLLALLMLSVSWYCLQGRHTNQNAGINQTTLIISIFAFLTLADAPMYDAGIHDLYTYDHQLVAQSHRSNFCSQDGGLHWKQCNFSDEDREILLQREMGFDTHVYNPDTQIYYRFSDTRLIEQSTDNGETWRYTYFHDNLTNIEKYYLEHYAPYGSMPTVGGDILHDQDSGNVLFTLGKNGIIIVDKNQSFLQIGIDEYLPKEKTDQSFFEILIAPYVFPSIIIAIILFSIQMLGHKNFWYRLLIALSFGVWFLSYDLFSALVRTPDTDDLTVTFMISIIFITIVMLLIFSILSLLDTITQQKRKWYLPILQTLPAGILFFLTYYLWFIEVIPSHNWALDISYCIIILFIIYSIYQSYQLMKAKGETT
ncbi:MAG: hypothetical protein JEZ00_19905 [Anaerolineaceae bacterium]|nr:hypothetical protein [Anaerolineaceae bacterium]